MTETANEELRRLITAVNTNPAKVQFPKDPWGFTADLRKIGLKVASNVRGQKDKQDVLIATLAILAAHVKGRFDEDAKYETKRRQQMQEAHAERLPRQRQAGTVVPTPVVVEEKTDGAIAD